MSTAAPSRTLLFVDDDAGLRQYIAVALENTAWKVTLAAHGLEAMELYAPGKFDVVITDLNMPGMDGVGLTAAVKNFDPTQPVAILTGGASAEADPNRLQVADILLGKPISKKTLLSALESLVRARS